MTSRREPALRAALRLALAIVVIGGVATVYEQVLAARLLMPIGACLDLMDDTFRSVELDIATVNGEAVIRRTSTPRTVHVVGEQVVYPDPRTRITVSAAEGVIFQPAIFVLALIFAWPWCTLRALGVRALLAVPLLACLFLLDVPMILYGNGWYQEVSRFDPDRFSPLILWADFMNAGGRFALGVAAAALAVAGANRLLPTRPSPAPPAPPATAPPGAPPCPPAGRAA